MFRIARFIVQHKVGAVAVIALGVVFFAPDRSEQDEANRNPWSAPAQPAYAAAEEPSFIDDIVTEADTMLAESGMDPRETAEETVGRFDDAASQYERANSN